MMMAGSDDDLDEWLQSLPDKIVSEIDDTIRVQAQRLSDAQKQALRTMEAPPSEWGNLETSCRVEPGENPLEYIVKAGGDLTTKEIRGGSGVEYDYALGFVYGTSHQPARDFFWSTYNTLRDDMAREIHSSVEKALSK